MATLTSILGTDLISSAPSVLNANYNALNLGLGAAQTSIVAINASIASKISISSVAGSVLLVTTAATDKVIAIAKGTLTGSTSAGSVALIYNGVTKDASEVKQAAAADVTTYSLMYAETPGAATANVVTSIIANGDLVINQPKMIVQIIQ